MESTSRRSFLAPRLGLTPAAAERARLTYRDFGKTGLKLTPVSFGCMLVGDQSVIERAADMGIVHFDTARSYQGGNNERMVGAALKGRRQKVVISSKTPARTKAEALADLDTSLKEIGTDYLDIWYLHSRNKPEEVPDEQLEAQAQAKKAGKIRFAGVSTHLNMPEMLAHLVKRGQTDVILTSYNFTMAPDVGEAIRAARQAGVAIVAMKVMAGGFKRIQRGDRLYGADPGALTRKLSREGGMLSALKWVLKNESVDTAIIGITSVEELEENVRAMAEPFSERDAQTLALQLDRIRSLYCRMCGACTGACPRGIPVADVLRHLAYAEGYGQFPLARERFLELPQTVRQVRCADCGSCAVQCPNGVAVRERLARAQQLFA
jgi:aryl-alcohol dehydrogenase-like predicted oxidoreductase